VYAKNCYGSEQFSLEVSAYSHGLSIPSSFSLSLSHTQTHTLTDTDTQTHTHTGTHTHRHRHTHTHTHSQTQTHTHTDTHTPATAKGCFWHFRMDGWKVMKVCSPLLPETGRIVFVFHQTSPSSKSMPGEYEHSICSVKGHSVKHSKLNNSVA
jgi:hypothetical protein